jgi:hypothetical protein
MCNYLLLQETSARIQEAVYWDMLNEKYITNSQSLESFAED